jgi:pimeloyl-ACP methyl ester carboxylesterase
MGEENQARQPERITLRLPGAREASLEPFESASTRAGIMQVEALSAYRVEAARAGAESIVIPDVPDDTVVQVELDGGIRLWTSVGQLRQDLEQAGTRGGAPGELVLPASLQFGALSRGVGTLVIKGLRLFNIRADEFLARKLCQFWENRTLTPAPGFYRLAGERGNVQLQFVAPGSVPTDRPVLVFIHGTASSTEGSFSALWAQPEAQGQQTTTDEEGKTEVWEELRKKYGEHIYALQHRTLTVSPIENALDLVNALPVGACIHFVSHSRGGLVGELLCRGNVIEGHEPFDQHALNLLAGEKRQPVEREHLLRLNEALKARRLRIERFVRVACPARGTSLASGRLDQFFSLLASVVGRTAPPTVGPLFEFFTDLAVAVAKQRTDPAVLPGLEAMIPDSPVVRLLNTPPTAVDTDLTVIGGDIEVGGGALGTLATVITDVFLYDDDHDLVVDTRYMFGGAPRRGGSRFMFDHGGNVNHFHYFKNDKTALQLLRGLRGEQEGFKPYDVTVDQLEERFYRKRGIGPMPVVFVLPGIMGSHLAVKGDRIWVDLLDLAAGGLVDRLYIDAPDVQAEGLIASAYRRLIEFLAQTHDVRPFPYDWRQSVLDAGKKLAVAVEEALNSAEASTPQQPVQIVAHSLGGLVARAMLTERPDVWQRMCRHKDSRLVMLGTPNAGAFAIVRLLLGAERTLRQLALLDIHHSAPQLLAVISAFPGVLELLPETTSDLDLFAPALWQQVIQITGNSGVAPQVVALTAARSARARLAAVALDPQRVIYVAGLAPATPHAMRLEPAEGRVSFLATPRGDGRVPWDTGIPQGVPVWYMPAEHGDMADYDEGFEALADLLRSGTTTRLAREPFADARAVVENTVLPADTVPAFPDATDLARAALGGSSRPRRLRTAAVRKVVVGVVHGDLAFVPDPVAVGHYQGDTIVSAEDYLDRVLHGRLRKRLSLGLYPGPLDTVEVFLNPGGKPGGAIVIGLGSVGELSPGGLSRAFTRALLEYAIAQEEVSPGNASLELRLASVLIGTGAGSLPIEQSITSILRGVADANLLLESRKSQARLVRLEFIELYQDLAIRAARVLATVARDPELGRLFQVTKLVRTLEGGLYRAGGEEPPGWWSRLIVTETETGELKFSTPTERARAEVELVATQRAAVDRFLSEATASTRLAPELGGTLFELLVPNRLKEYAPEKRDIVLVLDPQSARYPWEMMFDPLSAERKPLAVQAGMLRQFETAQYREHPVMAVEPTALVVGDPVSKLPAFPPLPGARAEAQEVARMLRQKNYAVEAVIEQDANAVFRAFLARPYRVLHLAGHGVFEYVPDKRQRTCPICQKTHDCAHKVTGMVLGPETFLTPAVVQQMRRVPEFVFINCCHLGSASGEAVRDRHRLAANLATQLIRMGVRAVVAAGWEVDDRAALTFAQRLYQELLDGRPFGKAVLTARQATYEDQPLVNTWGAYQCYGDPDFTLNTLADHADGREKQEYVSSREAIVGLNNIVSRAKTATNQGTKEALAKEVKAIEESVERLNWYGAGEVHAALGAAWAEVEQFEQAIQHYRAALTANKAEVPVRAIEQLANMEARWAAKLAEQAAKSQERADQDRVLREALELAARAKRRIKALIDIAPTGERLAIYASACKRGVFPGANPEQRAQALREMQAAYWQAAEYKLSGEESDVYYPLIGWMDATILLGEANTTRQAFDNAMRQARESADKEEKNNPNFWNGVAMVDLDLRQRLADGNLQQHLNQTVKGYVDVLRLYGSPREKDSVLETLRFLEELLHVQGPELLAHAMAQLRDQISKT